ncbi:MAG: hypothetical protein AVDCRST_MAG47-2824, partial [uncultured Nocardioidaceae bacterium]
VPRASRWSRSRHRSPPRTSPVPLQVATATQRRSPSPS